MERNDSVKSQSTEQLILQAAEKEFMQKGYSGARTSTIAESAGVTHAMMHYYFRTKENLFEKIFSQKISLVRDILLCSIGNEGLPLFERISTAVEHHYDFLKANPHLPRFIVNEVMGNDERMSMMFEQLRKHAPGIVASLQRQIDEYAERGECRKVSATMLMLDIVSLNIFSFMAAPLINLLFDGVMDKEDFAEMRKKENVETIMRKLKADPIN